MTWLLILFFVFFLLGEIITLVLLWKSFCWLSKMAENFVRWRSQLITMRIMCNRNLNITYTLRDKVLVGLMALSRLMPWWLRGIFMVMGWARQIKLQKS